MSDHKPADEPVSPALTLQALLYAGGELGEAEAAAFERRLGGDQSAREALQNAVRLSLAVTDSGMTPDPGWRDRARRRLLRRPSTGRPLIWAGIGAAAALVVVTLLAPAPPMPPTVPAREPPAAPLAEQAAVWAELSNSRHLNQAHDEDVRRKQRAEERSRLAKVEGDQPEPVNNSGM